MFSPEQRSKFKILSFDLDNALYDNHPVIVHAEKQSEDYLREQFKLQGKAFDYSSFMQIRRELLLSGDIEFENMSYFRHVALARFCEPLENSRQIVEQAFERFIQARSLIKVEPRIQELLKELSERYQLVSVTNGNCDINQTPLGQFFISNYSATEGYRAKPHAQMLRQLMQDFSVGGDAILHLGDSLNKDGGAAKNAGVAFYHFWPFDPESSIQREVSKLSELLLT
ncbi:MAG: HAD-IA family hydrolase [Kangiellaceae bacterium]|nr:HAD-IA family hydrolase [Kangiellaceae bacterium]